jgi:hypothetical protein
MLQPKREKNKFSRGAGEAMEERAQARKREFNYKREEDTRRFEPSSKPPVKRMYKKITSEPVLKLKTKKAKAVDNAPMPKTERVAQNFSASKPKMKTLKGKIQLALMKAKKG